MISEIRGGSAWGPCSSGPQLTLIWPSSGPQGRLVQASGAHTRVILPQDGPHLLRSRLQVGHALGTIIIASTVAYP